MKGAALQSLHSSINSAKKTNKLSFCWVFFLSFVIERKRTKEKTIDWFQFNSSAGKERERSENQSILERQSINLLIDGAVMVDWTSGKPTSFARRQAHSSHLCFVGPLCAIKNKERDEMEGFVAASRMSFRWFRSFSLHFINSIFYFYNKFHFMKLKLNFLLLSLTPPPRWRSLLHSKKTFTFLWLRIIGYGLSEPSQQAIHFLSIVDY